MKIAAKSGIFWSVIGITVIFLSLILEALSTGSGSMNENLFASGALAANLLYTLLKLLDVTGIAFLVLGVIHIMIETEDWSNYFRDRMREIVMEQSYLNTLDKDKLTVLQTSVLKAQFEDQSIDREGSFLSYLRSNLHHYIVEPYREDVTAEVIYTDAGDCWEVFERVTYVCRKATKGILRNYTWQVDPGEYVSIENLKVEIQFPYTHEQRGKKETLYDDKPDFGPPLLCSLAPYENVDGLIVISSEKFRTHKSGFQYWTMADPTKNFDVTLTFPSNHEVQVKPMVLNPDLVLTTTADGYYKAKYDFWMLPESGMTWRLRPKDTMTASEEPKDGPRTTDSGVDLTKKSREF